MDKVESETEVPKDCQQVKIEQENQQQNHEPVIVPLEFFGICLQRVYLRYHYEEY